MRTTLTKGFTEGLFRGLAGVSRSKSRKQVLQEIVKEAMSGIDMARGLQGRGDWAGSKDKLKSSAQIIDQALDLAETLPGVQFDKIRRQVKAIDIELDKASGVLDTDMHKGRSRVKDCEQALVKAVRAVGVFADALNDDVLVKEGIDFDENRLIKEALNPYLLKSRNVRDIRVEKKKPKLGTGTRFRQLAEELGKRPGVTDPEALAAWIGRKKYGKKRFQELAAAGKSVEDIIDTLKDENEDVSGFLEKKKPRIGSGERFARLKGEIAERGGARDPGAVAAAIGRKKYGKERFQEMAARGRKRK